MLYFTLTRRNYCEEYVAEAKKKESGGKFTRALEGESKAMPDNDKPIVNPMIVLREEFDDWAILFDPDSGKAFGLNPTSVFIWKCLDGQHTIEDILIELRKNCEDVSGDAGEHLEAECL